MAIVLQDLLVGTFHLVALEARRSDGDVSHPFGTTPVGIFVFDADGNYSVQLMDSDRSGGQLAAGTGQMAMFGTYEIDEAGQTFTLTPVGATVPALIGSKVLRHVRVRDGLAVFNTPPQTTDGLETTTYISWRKVSPL